MTCAVSRMRHRKKTDGARCQRMGKRWHDTRSPPSVGKVHPARVKKSAPPHAKSWSWSWLIFLSSNTQPNTKKTKKSTNTHPNRYTTTNTTKITLFFEIFCIFVAFLPIHVQFRSPLHDTASYNTDTTPVAQMLKTSPWRSSASCDANTCPIKATSGSNESPRPPLLTNGLGTTIDDGCARRNGHQMRGNMFECIFLQKNHDHGGRQPRMTQIHAR